MRTVVSVLVFVSVALASCDAPPPAAGFVALDRDFASFRTWTRFEVPPIAGAHEADSAHVYVSALPPTDSTAFPVGTLLVKTEEVGTDESQWELHAMVKRGGGFNPMGARGWEYFGLAIPTSGAAPVIAWRGEGPSNGDGYGRRTSDASAPLFGCNHCHAAAVRNDSVLTDQLQFDYTP